MKNSRKDFWLGLSICVISLALSAVVIYPLVTFGILSLSVKFDAQRKATGFLLLGAVVAFITYFDLPERIRKSEALSSQAILLCYLSVFSFFVFGFSSVFSTVGIIGKVLIFSVLVAIDILSLFYLIRPLTRARSDKTNTL